MAPPGGQVQQQRSSKQTSGAQSSHEEQNPSVGRSVGVAVISAGLAISGALSNGNASHAQTEVWFLVFRRSLAAKQDDPGLE